MSAETKIERVERVLLAAALPTAAGLCAEDAARAGLGCWCCPLCGGLNSAVGESSALGFCQHTWCVDGRLYRRQWLGVTTGPELLACLVLHSQPWGDA